jgi:hypothetical protein
MADANPAAHDDISRNVLHPFGVEGGLELRAHETITLTRVDQSSEVDGEHGKVKRQGNDNQGEDASHEVLAPETDWDILVVAKQNPQLYQSQDANPRDREEANPFDADSDAQAKPSVDQPEPPGGSEGLGRTLLVLVGEGVEGESGIGGSSDEGRIKKDQARLRQQSVF